MPSYLGCHYILRVIDHLSTYGFVGKLKSRNSEEMGDELVHILSSSMMPDVLQSYNGSDVSDLPKLLLHFLNLLLRFLLNLCPHISYMLHPLFTALITSDQFSS
jgi:hypothetical protein